MIWGISGQAGAGKDTIADHLVARHGFVRIGFADPMKRFVRDVFDFTDDQVFGRIDDKSRPDPRYRRPNGDLLTPRYALQTLGTEWGRDCYENLWVEYALRIAQVLLGGKFEYHADTGPIENWRAPRYHGVVFSDCRFLNEIDAVKGAGGKVIRVVRPGFDGAVGVPGHRSEAEQKDIPDDVFDAVVLNRGSLEDLARAVDELVSALTERSAA